MNKAKKIWPLKAIRELHSQQRTVGVHGAGPNGKRKRMEEAGSYWHRALNKLKTKKPTHGNGRGKQQRA